MGNASFWRHRVILEGVTRHLAASGLVDGDRVAYAGLSSASNQMDYYLANGVQMDAAIYSTCCLNPYTLIQNPLALWEGFPESRGWGNPLRDPDFIESWRRISPVFNVSEIDTAILVNSADEEAGGFKPMLAWMRELKKPMEAYIYDNEYHVKSQPRHRGAIYRRNIQWLQFWLQGLEDTNPVDPEQYARWRAMRDERCGLDETPRKKPSYCEFESAQ